MYLYDVFLINFNVFLLSISTYFCILTRDIAQWKCRNKCYRFTLVELFHPIIFPPGLLLFFTDKIKSLVATVIIQFLIVPMHFNAIFV